MEDRSGREETNMMSSSRLYSTGEAAAELGLSRRRIQQAAQSGIAGRLVGSCYVFSADDIEVLRGRRGMAGRRLQRQSVCAGLHLVQSDNDGYCGSSISLDSFEGGPVRQELAAPAAEKAILRPLLNYRRAV